jgi:hypothetical protein
MNIIFSIFKQPRVPFFLTMLEPWVLNGFCAIREKGQAILSPLPPGLCLRFSSTASEIVKLFKSGTTVVESMGSI